MRQIACVAALVILLVGCQVERLSRIATPTELRAATPEPPEKRKPWQVPEIPSDVPTARAIHCPEEQPIPEGMTRVELWYSYFSPEGIPFLETIVVVRRDIPATDAIINATLEAWIEGPTADERKRGVVSGVPRNVEVLGINTDRGSATVDLNEAFERNGLGTLYEGWLLTELAGIVTQFSGIDRVVLRIEGEENDYFGGHGFIIENGLRRPERRGIPHLYDLCLS
ncbi:MAG: GerMN domain-containing protein [Actinomycetota bacterium]|nr:GerMN domain-containing protein [Actinomycetota bacterium]